MISISVSFVSQLKVENIQVHSVCLDNQVSPLNLMIVLAVVSRMLAMQYLSVSFEIVNGIDMYESLISVKLNLKEIVTEQTVNKDLFSWFQ